MVDTSVQQYLNKPTAAVHIRNSFTATERKLVNICLHEGLKDNFVQDQYALDVWKTLKLLGCEKSKNSAWLKDELFDALRAKPIRWNVLKKDSKLQEWTCSFLSGYVYEPEDGKLAFQFNPIAVKQFQERRLYSKLILQIQAPIKSSHALTLYEYLNDELQRQKNDILNKPLHLDDLRTLLDIGESQYPEFKHLNQRAIKPAFKEINELTDVEATYGFIKEKRSVVALCITAKRRKNFQLSLGLNSLDIMSGQKESPESVCVQLLMAYGITKNKAIEIGDSVPIEQIITNLRYTIDRHKENKVQNFASYLIKAINDGYGSSHSPDEWNESLKYEWESHKRDRSLELFKLLAPNRQQALRNSYIESIDNDGSRTFARDKFKHDGGWNSRYIENDFRSKVMFKLLESPIDVDFEAFKEWWPQHELQKLLAEASNNR